MKIVTIKMGHWLLALTSLLAFITTITTATTTTSNRISFTEKNGTNYTVFEHGLRREGICETTDGVKQYSGYLSIDEGKNIWFWFFKSRHSPETSPLVTWFNGGPGCSSMIGLFQENGPCHFTDNQTAPSLNEFSFNAVANMLYVDQPVGVGFSYGGQGGVENGHGQGGEVNSTKGVAVVVWKALRMFLGYLESLKGGILGYLVSMDWCKSYGGHYAPIFASHIQSQNRAIQNGHIPGQLINLTTIGINNAWIDPSIQEKAYIDYAYDNPYRQLITRTQRDEFLHAYETVFSSFMRNCTEMETNEACKHAERVCHDQIEGPISTATDFDVYDVRLPAGANVPPKTYVEYLREEAIGARKGYVECPGDVYHRFKETGDNARTHLTTLTILLWAGDADWICNWIGNEAVANAISFDGQEEFRGKRLESYFVDGVKRGVFKSAEG